MLYEEMEKKEIERVYAAFADYIRESPYLEWLWSDKLGYLLLKISTKGGMSRKKYSLTPPTSLPKCCFPRCRWMCCR